MSSADRPILARDLAATVAFAGVDPTLRHDDEDGERAGECQDLSAQQGLTHTRSGVPQQVLTTQKKPRPNRRTHSALVWHGT
jgi:hypothetical protein